jgi:acetyl esterase/lipase
MSTIQRVAPEHREMAAGFPLFETNADGLAVFRAGLVEGLTALVSPEPSKAETVRIARGEEAEALRILVHRPDKKVDAAPAIIYLHGGGGIAGTPDMMAGASDRIANAVGAVVIAPDYRLAPEAPFPAAIDDAYTTLAWAHANAEALGIDPTRISVMGDSAGGCLAAGLALLARDRQSIPVRAQFLVYPMLDYLTGTDQALRNDPNTGEFVWARPQNSYAWHLARGAVGVAISQLGYFSPTYMADLSKLPPTFIIAAELDLYREEDIDYAQRLIRAGVPTDLVVYAGAVHAFDVLPGELSDRARNDLVDAIRRLA